MNAAVSEDANLATADIKNFYLGTPLERYEYMYITRKQLPDNIIERYDLETFYVMVEITKGIYGLPQAGRLAQEKLMKHLATHGYRSTANTPCLFKHESKPVAFTLVVDDFLIKYGGRSDLDHLLDALRQTYEITVDIEAVKYVGDFTVTWQSGKDNLADYFIKAHLVHHYKAMRSTFVSTLLLLLVPRYNAMGRQQAARRVAFAASRNMDVSRVY